MVLQDSACTGREKYERERERERKAAFWGKKNKKIKIPLITWSHTRT